MLEMQNFRSSFTLENVLGLISPKIFETFLKFLYYGDLHSGSFSVKEALYLYECGEFYGLRESADCASLKTLAEGKIRQSLDRNTILTTLDLAHKL